jgi:hypothetical protein
LSKNFVQTELEICLLSLQKEIFMIATKTTQKQNKEARVKKVVANKQRHRKNYTLTKDENRNVTIIIDKNIPSRDHSTSNKEINLKKIKRMSLEYIIKAEQMNINPFTDERGLPIIGRENDFYDWEKKKSEKKFQTLTPEQQIIERKTNQRFANKMNS